MGINILDNFTNTVENNYRLKMENLNILPINDIQPHRHDEHCICNPSTKEYNNVLIITHNSFDGREFKEIERRK